MCPMPPWRISDARKNTSATPTQKLTQRYFSSRPGDGAGSRALMKSSDPAPQPHAWTYRPHPGATPGDYGEGAARRAPPLHRSCATAPRPDRHRPPNLDTVRASTRHGFKQLRLATVNAPESETSADCHCQPLPVNRKTGRSICQLRSERNFVVHAAAEAAARSPTGPAARSARRAAAVATARTTR